MKKIRIPWYLYLELKQMVRHQESHHWGGEEKLDTWSYISGVGAENIQIMISLSEFGA
jgi:hypothetical protein